MKKYPLALFLKKGLFFILSLSFLAVLGCAGVTSTIPEEKRIILTKTDNYQGTFKSGPFTLQYSYTLNDSNMIVGGSNMILAGRASFSGGLDSLDIRILFLDKSGTVLQKKLIYSSGFRSNNGQSSNRVFEKTLDVPPGASAISFTYSEIERSSHR